MVLTFKVLSYTTFFLIKKRTMFGPFLDDDGKYCKYLLTHKRLTEQRLFCQSSFESSPNVKYKFCSIVFSKNELNVMNFFIILGTKEYFRIP